MSDSKRQSITIGPDLAALLATGFAQASTFSQRVNVLAARMAALLARVQPPSWKLAMWVQVIRLGKAVDLTHPAASFTLAAAAKASKDATLTYALDALEPTKALYVIAVIEAHPPGPISEASTLATLEGMGIAPPPDA